MNGKQYMHVCLGGLIVTAYGIYMISNPSTDGMAFGTVAALLGLLAGIKLKEAIVSPM